MFLTALPERKTVAGAETELLIKGEGQPVLFLHAGHGFDPSDPLIERLAKTHKVVAPSLPGFGASPRPHDVTTVDDIAYRVLDLIEELDLTDIILVGVSFGGWVAAELATKGTGRIAKLVLIDPLGVKFGDRESRDIVDIYAHTAQEIPAMFFADEAKGMEVLHNLDFKDLPEETALRFARNREALTLFGYNPTLYNPKLKSRLHRIKVPTLVVSGAEDRITVPDYGRNYAAAIPGARFENISGAGHYGYLEQPAAFADKIEAFLG
ncbi:alpha/beta hydrolase [Sphingomonas sp. AOB5]|uniref:alpha/beta fold hydrolase n=1 Tax=Sphingomonas sp. AOB5 TaxID=3034017 RepID=UPI0023F93EC1|nr:alpha/beta hydrolase [Sphingomonas sp. AOB5]MDF7774767.1 alpha/beta hydrolase [Sphingomonas sp. AOB5]